MNHSHDLPHRTEGDYRESVFRKAEADKKTAMRCECVCRLEAPSNRQTVFRDEDMP